MEYKYQQTTRIDRIIFFGIVLLLIFAPLAFGSVHVWAYSIVEFGVFFLLILWFVDNLIFSGSKTRVNFRQFYGFYSPPYFGEFRRVY